VTKANAKRSAVNTYSYTQTSDPRTRLEHLAEREFHTFEPMMYPGPNQKRVSKAFSLGFRANASPNKGAFMVLLQK